MLRWIGVTNRQQLNQIKIASLAEATCPICNKLFPFDSINSHIDSCLSNGEGEPTNASQKRKRDSDGHCRVSDQQPRKKSSWGSLLKSPSTVSQKSQMKIGFQRKTPSSGSKDSKSELKLNPTNSNSEVEMVTCAKMGQSSNSISSTSSSFQQAKSKPKVDFRPLPERMRPKQLGDYIGQTKAVGMGSMLRRLLEADDVPSMILWGPPGCGKVSYTTLGKKKFPENIKVQFSKKIPHIKQIKSFSCEAGECPLYFDTQLEGISS